MPHNSEAFSWAVLSIRKGPPRGPFKISRSLNPLKNGSGYRYLDDGTLLVRREDLHRAGELALLQAFLRLQDDGVILSFGHRNHFGRQARNGRFRLEHLHRVGRLVVEERDVARYDVFAERKVAERDRRRGNGQPVADDARHME